jgi:hypothetical protein
MKLKPHYLSLIFLFVVLFISLDSDANTAKGNAIFDKLLNISRIHDVDDRVKVTVSSEVSGSYTDQSGTIFLATNDIAFCAGINDCIAFIVAHEIGHNVLGHVRGHVYRGLQEETDADLYAVKLTHAAGFDPCAGGIYFKKIHDYEVSQGSSTDDGGLATDPDQHPNSGNRAIYLEAVCHSYVIDAPSAPWIERGLYSSAKKDPAPKAVTPNASQK